MFLGCTHEPALIPYNDIREDVGVCSCKLFEHQTNIKLLLALVISRESRHKFVAICCCMGRSSVRIYK